VQANNESGIYEVPTLGGTPRLIEKSVSRHTATVSPDHKSLAFIENGNLLVIVDLIKGTRRVASKALPGEYWYGISWHPNGRSIAGTITDSDKVISRLYTIDPDTGVRKEIKSFPWRNAYELTWLADGSGIILSGTDKANAPRQIWRVSYPDGRAERITNDTNSYFGISLTRDGNSLLTTKIESDRGLWLSGSRFRKYGEKITISKTKNEGLLGVSFVPGDRILFTVVTSKGSNIWSANLDGSNSRQLTFDSFTDFFPKISPDGRRIIFISSRNGKNDLWSMKIDGTDLVQITDTPEQESFPSFGPDGDTIVYQRADMNNDVTVWKLGLNSRSSVQLSKDPVRRPVISEDGKFVAGVYGFGDEKECDSVAVYSIDGGKPLKILDLPQVVKSIFRWSDDGNGLIYIDNRNGADNLWEQPFDSKPPKQLTDFDSHEITAFDISKDGKNFLLSRGESFYDLVIIGDLKRSN
ncbi:MAG: PD40 domain-containing protein, partial [Acidobacteria bacterium]|nr:PD40 domain-containing protein [Acidobacteriota bacterium]